MLPPKPSICRFASLLSVSAEVGGSWYTQSISPALSAWIAASALVKSWNP